MPETHFYLGLIHEETWQETQSRPAAPPNQEEQAEVSRMPNRKNTLRYWRPRTRTRPWTENISHLTQEQLRILSNGLLEEVRDQNKQKMGIKTTGQCFCLHHTCLFYCLHRDKYFMNIATKAEHKSSVSPWIYKHLISKQIKQRFIADNLLRLEASVLLSIVWILVYAFILLTPVQVCAKKSVDKCDFISKLNSLSAPAGKLKSLPRAEWSLSSALGT